MVLRLEDVDTEAVVSRSVVVDGGSDSLAGVGLGEMGRLKAPPRCWSRVWYFAGIDARLAASTPKSVAVTVAVMCSASVRVDEEAFDEGPMKVSLSPMMASLADWRGDEVRFLEGGDGERGASVAEGLGEVGVGVGVGEVLLLVADIVEVSKYAPGA